MEATTINRIEDVLRQCGVTGATLTTMEKEALDRQGYVVLPGLTDADWLARLRAAFEASAQQPSSAGKQSGTRHTSGPAWERAPLSRARRG